MRKERGGGGGEGGRNFELFLLSAHVS